MDYINKSILQYKWPKNDSNVEDDPYKSPIFAYSREMG
jgi:hypothetical protein